MKYFLGFVASIALIVAVFFLVLRGLTGGGEPPTSTRTKLTSYADTQTTMRLTVDGPIKAEQEHNAYQITVSRDETVIETFQGYEQTVIDRVEYPNTEEGYRQFLGALDRAGFNHGTTEGKDSDPVGVCATGSTVRLQIVNGSSELQNFWTTTCDEKGTFQGSLPRVTQLFRAQVPDFSKLTRKLDL